MLKYLEARGISVCRCWQAPAPPAALCGGEEWPPRCLRDQESGPFLQTNTVIENN